MDEILINKRYRFLFLLSSLLLVLGFLLIRYTFLPHWNPSLSRGKTEIIARLAEGLATTLITTVLVGSFIFFVTPSIMRRAKIEAIEPKGINPLLKEASLKSIHWIFKGGMGRYTRAETLPMLIKRARESGVRRKLRIMLIDPENEKVCQSYASYRNGLPSAKKSGQLTAESVRQQILATVLAAAKAGLTEPMLDVELILLPVWSVMRIDLSDDYVVVTSEDSREPGLRADSGTHFYGTYSKDLDLQAKQGKLLPALESFSNVEIESPADLKLLMQKLTLAHADLDGSSLQKLWDLISTKAHQYA
jgi:hypothetical protein